MDRLSLTLRSCNNVMSGISPGARETDHPKTMRKIIEKLPYNLQDQWRRLADHIHEQEHRRARFEDIVDFVEREGTALAELGRFWEALTFWDQAVALRPNDAELHEMRAQALLQLHELHPAAEAAARAAALRPRWSAAQQTLGRTLLGLGELSLARRAFSLALHLQPDDAELRTDDLLWTSCLLERARRRGCLGATGGVVSDEQTDTLLNLLRWPASATAGAARCHVDWQPLAEDWLAEEREKERAEELREEEQAEERARRDAEEEERQRRAAARRARNASCGDMSVDPE
ncbi:Tetratricopeptide repeat protein 33 [Amphibalanus amphitrite]|uniref:Tetratricopeptide repeat protein 33 n=1 Tax=Amphibalanus amphitrite TaxID=1232801 RepID=A0A6A4WRR3_AMPAM|nr:Tetratricopeptide repeat protein 33 [Amphibalanus amphitrite]